MPASASHRQVAADLLRQKTLATLLDALVADGVDVLVIKGAALALVVYDAPHRRERCDADLLIRRPHLEAAERVLFELGYRRQLEPDAEVAAAQRHYTPPTNTADVIDLHWRVANPLAFGDVLQFDDVWSRRLPLPALGERAWTLSAADALLLACVHRVAHHADRVELRWLQDIDLLVRRLDGRGRAQFVAAAQQSKTRAVCVRSLELSHATCATPVDRLIAELHSTGGADEPSAVFVGGNRALAEILLSDLRQGRWRTRVALLRELLFPGLRYIRQRYPRWPAPLLPLAYAHRIARGAPAWLRRQR